MSLITLIKIFRKWKAFGLQKAKSGQRGTTLRHLKNLVEYNGGGDHEALFAAYYTANGTKQAKSGKNFVHEIPLVKKLLHILQKQHKNANDFQKRQWLSIPLKAGFSRQM